VIPTGGQHRLDYLKKRHDIAMILVWKEH